MTTEETRTPQEEGADWAMWLDRFEQHIWPVFQRRGFSKDAAATIYFTRIPDAADITDEDEEL